MAKRREVKASPEERVMRNDEKWSRGKYPLDLELGGKKDVMAEVPLCAAAFLSSMRCFKDRVDGSCAAAAGAALAAATGFFATAAAEEDDEDEEEEEEEEDEDEADAVALGAAFAFGAAGLRAAGALFGFSGVAS
jgi:hypothetical protein